jgi:predicted site-specific integrase-resolvase
VLKKNYIYYNNMENEEYVTATNIRKKYKITSNTLRNWGISGKVRFVRPNQGNRLYNLEDVRKLFGEENFCDKRKTICYARVSSSKQKEDLERQKERLKEDYKEAEIISDIGSGLNWKRKGFCSILERILNGDIKTIVVTYKDRICRFGFELFESICKNKGTDIVVLNKTEENIDETQELQEDLLAIITFFTARHHGKRSHKNKIKKED